jgi:small nuclear ribonucleoprotein (snRNP)-like protein
MEPAESHWIKQFRTVTVKMKDGTVITGKLNIGDRQSPDQYLVLADAEHRGSSGKVVIINKGEIVWVEPEDK